MEVKTTEKPSETGRYFVFTKCGKYISKGTATWDGKEWLLDWRNQIKDNREIVGWIDGIPNDHFI